MFHWERPLLELLIPDIPDILIEQLCVCVPTMGSELVRCVGPSGTVHWMPVYDRVTKKLHNGCGKPLLEEVLFWCEICEEYFIELRQEENVVSVLRHARNNYKLLPNTKVYYCDECI